MRRTPILAGLFAVLAMPQHVGAAEPPSPSEIERLYVEGDGQNASGHHAEAAATWTRLLELMPPLPENTEIRELLLINIIAARVNAHERERLPDGRKDLAQLEAAKQLADAFVAADPEHPPSARVTETIAELDGLIAKYGQTEPEIVGPCLSPPPCLSPLPERRGCGSENAPQTALVGLLPLGWVARRRRREVLERLAARLPADVLARLRARDDDDER